MQILHFEPPRRLTETIAISSQNLRDVHIFIVAAPGEIADALLLARFLFHLFFHKIAFFKPVSWVVYSHYFEATFIHIKSERLHLSPHDTRAGRHCL